MEHMKKSWEKIIKTILGVLVGNLVLSFAVAAFIVPNGIIMGGATGIGQDAIPLQNQQRYQTGERQQKSEPVYP